MILAAYIIFVLIAGLAAWRLPASTALLCIYLGGWIFLPVGIYPPGTANADFPYWIVGGAIPTEMLIQKSWIVPSTAFFWCLTFHWRSVREFKPTILDLPIVFWCLWPMASSFLTPNSPDPSGPISTVFLLGVWGLSWLLGRIWLSSRRDELTLVIAIAMSGAACLPIAFLEGIAPSWLYGLLYEPHPFRTDGVNRYIGYRPLGFFENGNQYGTWVVVAAVASIWLAINSVKQPNHRKYTTLAACCAGIALASQSIGAIGLGIIALILLSTWHLPFTLPFLFFGSVTGLILVAVHLSGIIPMEHIARRTPWGKAILQQVRDLGRGSLTWRLSQDIKTLPYMKSNLLTGTSVWDWWRPANTRAWGLILQILGQFGLTGLLTWATAIFVHPLLALARHRRHPAWESNSVSVLLAALIAIAVSDAVLNSFFYFPAILIAGSLASRKGEGGL